MKGNETMKGIYGRYGYKFWFKNGTRFDTCVIHAESVSKATETFKRDYPNCVQYKPCTIVWEAC